MSVAQKLVTFPAPPPIPTWSLLPTLPGISPVYGDMPGLPPDVMRSAGDDPLPIDADKIETAVAATGTGVVDNHRFDNLWHVFHLQAVVLAKQMKLLPISVRGCAPIRPNERLQRNELIR